MNNMGESRIESRLSALLSGVRYRRTTERDPREWTSRWGAHAGGRDR